MKNLVTLNQDGTANILCDKEDGSIIPVRVDASDLVICDTIPGKWCVAATNTSTMYCTTMYTDKDGNRKRVYLHRLIMKCPAGLEVDHFDSNGLNNTRANLSIMTRKQNAAKMRMNHRARATNRLGVRGVYQEKRTGHFCVQFRGKWVGTFETIKQAQRVYNKMRTEVNLSRTGRE